MKFVLYLSEAVIPLLLLYIVGYGLWKKKPVYQYFLDGAKDGVKTVAEILPTLIGLMVGVGVLRASGFLDFIAELLGKFIQSPKFPVELIPVAIVKMFSSSAATGLLIDLFEQYGTDSYVGRVASVMLSSTETIFYTMSVYFLYIKVKKTRYTLVGALFASFVGILASVWIVGLTF